MPVFKMCIRDRLSAEKELEGVVVDQVIQQLIAKVEIPR